MGRITVYSSTVVSWSTLYRSLRLIVVLNSYQIKFSRAVLTQKEITSVVRDLLLLCVIHSQSFLIWINRTRSPSLYYTLFHYSMQRYRYVKTLDLSKGQRGRLNKIFWVRVKLFQVLPKITLGRYYGNFMVLIWKIYAWNKVLAPENTWPKSQLAPPPCWYYSC